MAARQTFPDLRNSYVPEDAAQDGTEHLYGQLYVYIQGSPVQVQTPTHWNLFGHSMTNPPPVFIAQ
jgi:hypothetical protein